MRRSMLYCPLAALLVLSGCSNQKQAAATAPSGPSDRVKLSDDATNMMADAQKARQSIAKKDKDGALRLVNDALDKLKDVQSRAAGKKVVPIYQEIETVTVWQPRAIIPNNPVAAAKQTSGSADRAKNRKLPEAAVAGVAGDVTTVAVDVPAAANELNAAKGDLDKGNLKAADSALADAQRAVIAASVAADLPLVRARENLVLAKKRAQANDWSGTRTALSAASDALNNYASANRTPHANDAQNVKKQIDDYAANLDQNHGDAVNKIQGWWEQTADWTSPPPTNQNQRASR